MITSKSNKNNGGGIVNLMSTTLSFVIGLFVLFVFGLYAPLLGMHNPRTYNSINPNTTYNPNRWMTNAYDDIKHLKLDEIPLLASHNALYSEIVGADLCTVQDKGKYIKDQFDAGARYFDVRPYLSEKTVTRNGRIFVRKEFKDYVYGGWHGHWCSANRYNVIYQMQRLANALKGSKEIVILELKKEDINPITKSTRALATNFYGRLIGQFGRMIIARDELRSMGDLLRSLTTPSNNC